MSGTIYWPGIYRRRIRIIAAPGQIRADMEDDAHRYGVIVRHEDGRVTGVEGIPLRTPWDLCVNATSALDRLAGMPLDRDFLAAGRHTNAKLQCTHMFDLASLAISHAARGTLRRQYDVEINVDAATHDAPREAILFRDGQETLRWIATSGKVLAPPPFAGQDMTRLLVWARNEITDADEFEAIFILRRAMNISRVREYDLDKAKHAIDIGVMGSCFVYQPDIASRAKRVVGSMRDNSDTPDALLDDLPREPST